MPDKPTTVKITIDDTELEVPPGTLVIRAAEQLGTIVPRFCDHRLLAPLGRLPAVPGRGGRPAQAADRLHHDGDRRHGGQDPAHLRGGQGRPGGQPRAAADQPPARLPHVRQGRRVPAPGPDPGPRAGGDPLRRDQAPLREADQDLRDGAAGPGALRALRPLHPLLQRDRRRPVHRAVRAGGPGAGGHLRGRAVRERLLRQRRPDLPGRGADLAVLPVPGPAVRPGLDRRGLQPLRRRLQPAHRRPPGHGHPPARPRQRRGQRGLELRPGPLRLRLRPVLASGC